MLQVEKNILMPGDFEAYFTSRWRKQKIEEFSKLAKNTSLPTNMRIFRGLRDFLSCDLILRNGKRAGVMADLTVEDVLVSRYKI